MEPISLTFDDGPDPASTPALLDTLARHGLTATFFVIAPRAAAHPHLIDRMRAEGHRVGLHCDQHERHSHRDRAWLESDTRQALARLRALGVTATLWRTPWGDKAPWTAGVARRHRLRLIDWTVDTHDWRGDDAAMMFEATREQLEPGAIVLAHDGIGPGALRQDASQTIAYVQMLADYAAHRRLRCAVIS